MKELLDQGLIDLYLESFNITNIFDERINGFSRLYEFEKGDYIVEDGMPLSHFLFLVKGETKVYTTLENGKSYLLRIESPPSTYGDVEVMSKALCSANVTALTQCHIIAVPVVEIHRLYSNHPPFLKSLIESLSKRLVKISYKSTDDLLMPLRNKLASFMMIHIDHESDVVTFNTSLTEVAEQLGSTYRHLSRTFREMTDEGLIIKEGKKIRVLNKSELVNIAGNTYKT